MNGFADQEQKGQYAASVASIAERLGLPSWFVDLRHSATHDQLPSLVMLQNSAEQVNLYFLLGIRH